MKRHHVHLSADINTAKAVGNRHKGKTLILEIDTQQMVKNDFKFYLSDNKVWLVDTVPKKYIKETK